MEPELPLKNSVPKNSVPSLVREPENGKQAGKKAEALAKGAGDRLNKKGSRGLLDKEVGLQIFPSIFQSAGSFRGVSGFVGATWKA